MEATSDAKAEVSGTEKAKKKRGWGSAFYSFLASGGIILVLVAAVALAIAISLLIK